MTWPLSTDWPNLNQGQFLIFVKTTFSDVLFCWASLTFKDIQWAVVLQEGEEIFIFRSYKEEDLHIFPNNLLIFLMTKKVAKIALFLFNLLDEV